MWKQIEGRRPARTAGAARVSGSLTWATEQRERTFLNGAGCIINMKADWREVQQERLDERVASSIDQEQRSKERAQDGGFGNR